MPDKSLSMSVSTFKVSQFHETMRLETNLGKQCFTNAAVFIYNSMVMKAMTLRLTNELIYISLES